MDYGVSLNPDLQGIMSKQSMLNDEHYEQIAEHIGTSCQQNIVFQSLQPITGGCINQVSKATDQYAKQWLIKENSAACLDLFVAEAMGLKEIKQSDSLRVPEVVCYGKTDHGAYLVLEYIALSGVSAGAKTGEQLATMHRYNVAQFGWFRDNYIGESLQKNQQGLLWVEFWQQQRLLPQLNLALKKGYSQQGYEAGLKLAEKMPALFTCYSPVASLLHGDLWGGNQAQDQAGHPIVFDPAVYYGDRETDLAMTELFGGFSAHFYSAYNAEYRLDQGYASRKTLYNLYHILNHYNLFGAGYERQAMMMTQSVLAIL